MSNQYIAKSGFLEFLYKEVHGAVKENVRLESKKKRGDMHLLVVKSCNDHAFDGFVDCIKDGSDNIKMTVIGEFSDPYIYQKHVDAIQGFVYHGGRFSSEVADRMHYIFREEYDAVLFMNYSTSRESYLNVEEFCKALAEYLGLDVYAYIIGEQTYSHYKDIGRHIYAMKAYCSFLYYLDYEARQNAGG